MVTDGGDKIEREQFGTMLFRDSGLRNGSRLFMRPPQRERDDHASNEVDEDGEEGAIKYGEGGEDEMEEMMEGGED